MGPATHLGAEQATRENKMLLSSGSGPHSVHTLATAPLAFASKMGSCGAHPRIQSFNPRFRYSHFLNLSLAIGPISNHWQT